MNVLEKYFTYHCGGVVRGTQRVDCEALLFRVVCRVQTVEVLVAGYD